MSDVGDYYARCERERREALDRLRKAKCPAGCSNGVHYSMERDEARVCRTCGGTGRRPGVSYEEMRRLRDAYDRAANTGD